MCACTEPVRTGIGAVCVEYGRPKWPITMLNHRKMFLFFIFGTLRMLVRPAMKRLFLPEGKKRPRSLRSLGLASLLFTIYCEYCTTTTTTTTTNTAANTTTATATTTTATTTTTTTTTTTILRLPLLLLPLLLLYTTTTATNIVTTITSLLLLYYY